MHETPSLVRVFSSYAYEDEALYHELDKHLRLLQYQEIISACNYRRIVAGTDWTQTHNEHFTTASIILLLISPDFIASDYCSGIEMRDALARHRAGDTRVIPILLRPVGLSTGPFAHLPCLPLNAHPVTSWSDRDEAFLDIAAGIRDASEELRRGKAQGLPSVSALPDSPLPSGSPQHPTQEIIQAISSRSRRRFLALGIGIGAAIISSGAIWYASSRRASPSFITKPPVPPTILTAGSILFTYTGHTAPVFSAAWSPSGKRIASASYDNTAQVWNAASEGEPLVTYRGHTGLVGSAAWSPDGRRIASGGFDKTVQVWDAASGELLVIYRGHSGVIESLAWSPSGEHIASASYDNTVHVWDAASGGLPLIIYKGHTAFVASVAWSPDGRRIASASADKTIQVWDATTEGGILVTYTGHIGSVESVAWSPNGRLIASGSFDSTVKLWDTTTSGNALVTYTGHALAVSSVTWSPDSKHIASASYDNTVQVCQAI